MQINSVLRLLIVATFCFGTQHSFPQQSHKIDSLKNAIRLYDAQKKEMGNHASPIMDTVKVRLLNSLSIQYDGLYSELAIVYATEALNLAKKVNYKRGMAVSLNVIATNESFKSNYKQALPHYLLAVSCAKESKHLTLLADLYGNLGVLYAKQCKYPESLSYMMKGLNVAKRRKDLYGIAASYNNIGIIYMTQELYDEALNTYKDCLQVQQQLKDFFNQAVAYQNIGEIYFLKKNYSEALKYYQHGLKVAIDNNNIESAANSYSGIAKIDLQWHKYDNALSNMLISLKMRKQIGDSNGISNSYIGLGQIYYHKKDYARAIENLKKGLGPVKEAGELDVMQDAYSALSLTYNELKNYKLAYENHLLFKQVTDSIFSIEKDKKLTQLQLKYEFKIVQDSIKAAQDKKDIIAKKIEQDQKKTRNLIFAGLLMLVIFLIILLVQRNKLAEIKREKALEQERNRISRDLHDNLGAQLSTARMFVSSLKSTSQQVDMTDKIDNSIELLDASISDLRQIMNDMRASVLHDQGYLAATEELVNKINKLHLITFTLSHHKMEERLSHGLEHELYRITQELVNNTLKYAKATNVSIDLIKRDGQLIMMYEDDGVGFDAKNVRRGNGLNNIESRVKSVNGTVEFDSSPGSGFHTTIEIPL